MAYKKGYSFERELKKDFESKGWKVVRSGGSKKPDLIAAKDGKILVIECKVTSNNIVYLDKEEVLNLEDVAKHFGGECVYYIRKSGDKSPIITTIDQFKESENKFIFRLD